LDGRQGSLFDATLRRSAEPDIRHRARERANAHDALEREANLEFGQEEVAADAEVVVAEGDLDRDVLFAEDAARDVAGFVDGTEDARRWLVAGHGNACRLEQ